MHKFYFLIAGFIIFLENYDSLILPYFWKKTKFSFNLYSKDYKKTYYERINEKIMNNQNSKNETEGDTAVGRIIENYKQNAKSKLPKGYTIEDSNDLKDNDNEVETYYFEELLKKELKELEKLSVESLINSKNNVNSNITSKNENAEDGEDECGGTDEDEDEDEGYDVKKYYFPDKNNNNNEKRNYDGSYGHGPRGKADYEGSFEIMKNVSSRFSDVGGYYEVKKRLTQCVHSLTNPEEYLEAGTNPIKGVLLTGPPGTGKTQFVKALAGETGCSLIMASGADFSKKYMGEGVEEIKKIFKTAKNNKPVIIFFDEIDSVGVQRGNDGQSASIERAATLNTLLTELTELQESTGILFMGATNMPKLLDGALTRNGRIDETIEINLPDSESVKEIINIHLNLKPKKKPRDSSVNIDELVYVFDGLSGAEIAAVINKAMLRALRDNRKVLTMDDIEIVRDEIDVGFQAIKHQYSPEIEKQICIHEAGHALLGAKIKFYDRVKKIRINFSAINSPGYTRFEKSNGGLYRREKLFEDIMVLLAGRIAEEEIYEYSVTTGAISDIERVYDLAKAMMEKYGMADNGLIVFPVGSEKYKLKMDDCIVDLVTKAMESTKKIIHENSELLLIIANRLENKKVIYGDELYLIINKYDEDKQNKKIKIRLQVDDVNQLHLGRVIGIAE